MVAKLARKKRRLALPRTSSERRVWVRVSINGAIFSLILFSLAHLYRGWGVGFVTITLALLYVLTGNLLASMLWHMLFDVRFSFETPTIEAMIQQPANAEEPTFDTIVALSRKDHPFQGNDVFRFCLCATLLPSSF